MREILFKGAGVNLFEASVRTCFRFQVSDILSLHKMAVWSDASP